MPDFIRGLLGNRFMDQMTPVELFSALGAKNTASSDVSGAVLGQLNGLSAAPSVWTPEQQSQIVALEALRNLKDANWKITIQYKSEWEVDPKICGCNWLYDVYTRTLSALVTPEPPEILPLGSNRKTLDAQHTILTNLRDTLDLQSLLPHMSEMMSWAGFCTVKVVWSDHLQQPTPVVWEDQPGYYAFVEHPLGDPAFTSAIQFWFPLVSSVKVNNTSVTKLYYCCERQSLRTDAAGAITGIDIRYTAYTTNDARMPTTTSVPFAAIWPTATPPQDAYLAGITTLLGYRLTNVTGATDYTPALRSLQENWILLNTQRMVVVKIMETPMMSAPADYVDPTTGRLRDGYNLTIRQNGEQSSGIELNSWNGGLRDSATQEDILLKQMYLHVPLSPVLLGGGEVGANESGVSRALALHQSTVAIKSRRAILNRAITWLLKQAMALMNYYRTVSVPAPAALQLNWAAVLPTDELDQNNLQMSERQQLLAEYKSGVRSLQDVVSRLQDTEANITLELIRLGVYHSDDSAQTAQAAEPPQPADTNA